MPGRAPVSGRPATAADVRAVRARQRELLIPESFEWVERTAPDMAAAATEAGLAVHAHPLLVLGSLAPAPRLPERIGVRIMSPEDPDLILAWAVPGVAFNYPGTAIGEASRHRAGQDRGRPRRGHHRAAPRPAAVARVGARDRVRPQRAAGGRELPAGGRHRRDHRDRRAAGQPPARAWPPGVTRALAAHALASGARTVFLSATDATVARIYARLGFREIGTAMIAEPPEG